LQSSRSRSWCWSSFAALRILGYALPSHGDEHCGNRTSADRYLPQHSTYSGHVHLRERQVCERWQAHAAYVRQVRIDSLLCISDHFSCASCCLVSSAHQPGIFDLICMFVVLSFVAVGRSVHYHRIPVPYWRDRLLRVRSMGLNTIEVRSPLCPTVCHRSACYATNAANIIFTGPSHKWA